MLIAEIGQNWCSDISLAKYLIRGAKENGAGLCKFQLYDHNILYSDELPDVALSKEQAFDLFNYGEEMGIEVFFSVFDVERVKWCEEMGVKRYKIATLGKSKEVIDAVAGKPVIVSFPLPSEKHCAFWGGLKSGFWWGYVHEKIKDLTCLYCVPDYPAKELKFRHLYAFDGYSDHTIGLDAAKIAMSREGSDFVIEKHFAIDHKTGIDAQWSMTPDELRELKRFEVVVEECCGD